jgi:DNA-binding transcriptional MerR regulator
MSHSELLKIGDFARVANTNLRTLRYYEELGLLAPASRSRGGFRYYRRTDVHRVILIRDLQELGLALERIHDLIGSRGKHESRESFLGRVRAALEEQGRLLDERTRAIEEQRRKVHEALHKLAECRDCQHSPCAMNNFCEPCANTGAALPESLSALYQ